MAAWTVNFVKMLLGTNSIHNVPSDRPRALAARAIGKPPSRGALKNGELLKTAEHDFDVTREHGALLPEHVPIVCPSFAASDLAMLKDKSGNPVKFSEADDGTRVRDDEPREVDFNAATRKLGMMRMKIRGCDRSKQASLTHWLHGVRCTFGRRLLARLFGFRS